ncbi:MAG TPA: hypothetical protein VNS58_02300 [Puia sp.]|nr:hypothetical protein [Puia sp.]
MPNCYSGLAILVLVILPSLSQGQKTFSPAKEALKLFNSYKPSIEKHNNAIVDDPVVIEGDINGDNQSDCIISFIMTSKSGGNAYVGHECAIYLNTGTGMKVVGAFPKFYFCYSLEQIKDQVIYGREYECQPPYNKILRQRRFIYEQGRINIIP